MKTVFVLKITSLGKFGYFDGEKNWSEHLHEAKQYDSYIEAECFIKVMMENHGWGGFVQIEKYFVNN